ncbi:exonuclease SbcCD subunit D [Caryophanon tenue]|uniref:Nuclease SbcCD subunit D n=1 Tax=Caryophanon tenue TaxID=33978 RepID=A0A1C0YIC5_9BACL|nr:exonuclease SbcCD subunit D [Caryophanon tenue]OCS86932.1 exonuclease sbcCD subunit D [Caryophanon tenue]
MKLFHTADWHLGKLVQGVHMTEDQAFVLRQLIAHIEQQQPDAVIIAGDLYDRALPPVEAVTLLHTLLEEIAMTNKTPVLAIAGNHDSPARIHFGNKLMKKAGVHLVGELQSAFEPTVFHDEYGEVHVYLLPYVDPAQVKHYFKEDAVVSEQTAMSRIMQHYNEVLQPHARNVLVAHAFVTKHGEEQDNTSDSERALSVGGSDCVEATLFEAFDYVALGHLHQAHHVLRETIQYAGSPLKYSISEEHHKKGYLHVTLREKGTVQIDKVLLAPRRDMRTVSGYIDEILQHARSEDYVFVRLLDEQVVQSPMEQVRSVYPNAMHVERVVTVANEQVATRSERQQMSTSQLFSSFIEEMTGQPASPAIQMIFDDMLQETLVAEREV